MNGIEVLRQAKVSSPATIILMMSAYHMVDRAVEAMKLGAYDYLIKPFHVADMVNTLQRAAEMLALRVRVHDTVQSAKGIYDFGRVVTMSPVMGEVLQMARRAAESERTTILIQGESGTGKEVLAKAIHYNSPRAADAADQPELRRPARHAAGERVVRLRAGRVHRCPPPQGRPDRESQRRNALPRRDRQYLAQPAGQAAARSGRGHVHASRRDQGHPGQRSHHCRHQHAC